MESYNEHIKNNPPEKEPLPPEFDEVSSKMMDELLLKPYTELSDKEKGDVDAYKSAIDSARRSHLQ